MNAIPDRLSDVVFITTPPEVIAAMLDLAAVRPDDVLYDLGCGDGRIAIAAAERFGARAVGVDINPQRVAEAKENARLAGVGEGVQFYQQDVFASDFSTATVVTLYLMPLHNLKLRSALQQLQPGARVVSLDFDMGDWPPERVVPVTADATLYLWTIGD
ncbi:methylase involved in ubiquinone/menaquinone biosynthesis [Rubidibacter lacunae KORDI 51-2]|uniref:Methylase involved in ubiquinone/menaquinone biosynthesis n=1 Tax=Rubidibacter lacunae KORDI 51-2 TaxID=582515 RepID=U5DKM9_9CHRO|nr:methyltransferase domain-containing protein [Rubidibacter lacunae]ERN40275.1 methylase involved in ubiquinone/menaquinone biosynthesis [Rubidibacter lacunae KORDI 51-2]